MNSTGGGGGAGARGGVKALSDVASVRASSKGPTTDFTGSASGARMSLLVGGGCWGVVVPEGPTDVDLCQYMGSSSCLSSSSSKPS